MAEEVSFAVYRYRPGDKPYYAAYSVPVARGMTVLDALTYIKENLDTTLAFRASCRMGICGSCGMMLNGFPHLACHTQVDEVRGKGKKIEVAPLAHFPVVRDLVVDLGPLFAKHRAVRPYILEAGEGEESRQLPEELERYLQFAYCLKCGSCWAACPTAATDAHFLGPQALAQAYRYLADTRDRGGGTRLALVAQSEGAWRCHFAGNCSKACPKGVDPALGVQLLKRALVRLPAKKAVVATAVSSAAKKEAG
ncbi:MAG: succinate dehydrogenase iron-sulfur subunit [Clostridia bacterium]|nr:succinate dehydrogenase iron-sulfur subunit [Clostridia bacterium]